MKTTRSSGAREKIQKALLFIILSQPFHDFVRCFAVWDKVVNRSKFLSKRPSSLPDTQGVNELLKLVVGPVSPTS